MRKIEVEIFSDAVNAAIIRHPERQFPGVLVQGDTMFSMAKLAKNIMECLDQEDDLYWEMKDLEAMLNGFVQHYTSILKSHHMSLPFNDVKAD